MNNLLEQVAVSPAEHNTLKVLSLDYIAGIFDGEGSITTSSRNSPYGQVTIPSTDFVLVERIAHALVHYGVKAAVGRMTMTKNRLGKKPQKVVRVRSISAIHKFCELMIPRVVIPRKKAALQDQWRVFILFPMRNRGAAKALISRENALTQIANGKIFKPYIPPKKTYCKYGHPYAGNNLYTAPSGARHCKECRRRADKKSKEKMRERHKCV